MNILQKSVYSAAALGILSGAISLYWACGGIIGLATVGGPIEALSRSATLVAHLLAFSAAFIKFIIALLAISLMKRKKRHPRHRRYLIILCAMIGGLLLLYGAANVSVGALVLSDIIHRPAADTYALKWHVFLWDAYFVVWGGMLLLVAYAARRTQF